MAIGKRKEFCITSNKTIKKLIPPGKKKNYGTQILNFRTIMTIFFFHYICIYLLLVVESQRIKFTAKMQSCISRIFKAVAKVCNCLNFMLKQ